MKLVQTFGELSKEEMINAGGKGGTLARLYQKGYPVPDGFVIMPDTFTGDGLKYEAGVLIERNLVKLRHSKKDISFAVRSSALNEDSAGASFAGEFETVLGMRSTDDVFDAVKKVWNSSRSERVYEYTKAKGLDDNHRMAIVIQRMVSPELSGVLFTADPISGDRLRMTGNYVRGLGEQLVSGEVNPEAFQLTCPKGSFKGPEEIRKYAKRLYRIARQLEADLHKPQDIEWAVEGDKLYILQSRPITTLSAYNPRTGEWNDSLTGDYLWSNVNLSEAVPDIMTPFTWSVLQHEVEAAMLFDMPGNHPLMGNICGRPYFNFGLLISIPTSLGMKKENILKQAEETYGTIPESLDIPIIPFPALKLISGIMSSRARLVWNRININKELTEFLSANPSWCRNVRERIRSVDRPDALASLWHSDLKPKFAQSCVYLKYGMDKVEPIIKLRSKLVKMIGETDANRLLTNFSGKNGNLASLGPVIGISQIIEGKISEQEYIEQYGHRSEHEVELSMPRPAEDRDWLVRMLENCKQSGINADTLLEKQKKDSSAAWDKFVSDHSREAGSIGKELERVAAGARLREEIRSEYTRVFWVLREFALKAGELSGLGEKIFFLSSHEILDMLSGKELSAEDINIRRDIYKKYCALPRYPAIIRGRFDPFRWAEEPDRSSDVYAPGFSGADNAADVIKGFAGAYGMIEGKVRRLNSPDEASLLQKGEILVATTTNIGWTPLFPKAAAIVTDVGAPLSHAAIVARELGIPAVVGCCNATSRLHTGDWVKVDGSAGTVKILKPA